MKNRLGFVSNSSSSCFIVTDYKGEFKTLPESEFYMPGSHLIVDGSQGETEFGWDTVQYKSIWDRIHFAYIQVKYLFKYKQKIQDTRPCIDPPPEEIAQYCMDLLENVIKEYLNVAYIEWKISIDYKDKDYAYIDHQSASYEGQNMEIFDSEVDLEDFLFREGSYIQGGNDNEM